MKVSEPVQDAVKAYIELAFGLTEASRKKAEKTVKKVAKDLAGKGGATAVQLQTMVDELLATGNANREAVARMVRVEMDRALSRVGLATADEVSTLSDRVEALERQLRDAKAATSSASSAAKKAEAAQGAADGVTPADLAEKATVKKAVAKKAVAKKSPAKKAEPEVPAAAKKAPAKKAAAKKTAQ